jgi:hypothetical protein
LESTEMHASPTIMSALAEFNPCQIPCLHSTASISGLAAGLSAPPAGCTHNHAGSTFVVWNAST